MQRRRRHGHAHGVADLEPLRVVDQVAAPADLDAVAPAGAEIGALQRPGRAAPGPGVLPPPGRTRLAAPPRKCARSGPPEPAARWTPPGPSGRVAPSWSMPARISTRSPLASPSSSSTLSAPMKAATKGEAGRLKSSSGVPTCAIRPWSSTTMRSAITMASSRSWVTWSAVMPSRCCSARISWRSSWRMRASRLESGSSSSSSAGSTASARPSATRWRWPPERSPTLRSAEPGKLEQVQHLLDAGGDPRPAPAAHLQPVADVLGHAHMRPERVGLEDQRRAAPLGRQPRRCPGPRPGCGPARPARSRRSTRSSVVFPQPELPSRATNSPRATSSDRSCRTRIRP